jgi:hypothetical protein
MRAGVTPDRRRRPHSVAGGTDLADVDLAVEVEERARASIAPKGPGMASHATIVGVTFGRISVARIAAHLGRRRDPRNGALPMAGRNQARARRRFIAGTGELRSGEDDLRAHIPVTDVSG